MWAGVSAAPVQMWAGVSAVLVQMWAGGERSRGADVGGSTGLVEAHRVQPPRHIHLIPPCPVTRTGRTAARARGTPGSALRTGRYSI